MGQKYKTQLSLYYWCMIHDYSITHGHDISQRRTVKTE
jgi:hypothetical protein